MSGRPTAVTRRRSWRGRRGRYAAGVGGRDRVAVGAAGAARRACVRASRGGDEQADRGRAAARGRYLPGPAAPWAVVR